MLKLKQLSFSGIGRFVEKQTIDFDSLGKLIQVDGLYDNTGGSSGSGKTTVFNALDYLLGLNDIPSTVLKSRFTDDGIFVEGVFDHDGNPLTISRGKKLSIEEKDKTTIGSSSLAEERLDAILAMPRDLFRKMLHKRQGEGGFFLQMAPKDINEFLMDCLGLSSYKAKIEIADKKAKELSDKKVETTNNLNAAQSALKATQEASSSIGLPPVKEIQQSDVVSLKSKHEKSSVDHSTLLIRHKLETETLELSRPAIENKFFDKSIRDSYEREIKEADNTIRAYELGESNRRTKENEKLSHLRLSKEKLSGKIRESELARNEGKKTALEIKKIKESLCPTCEQTWITEKAKIAENALLEKIKKIKEIIVEGDKAKEELEKIESQIATCLVELKPCILDGITEAQDRKKKWEELILIEKNKEKDFQNAQYSSNKIKLDDFATKQKELRERHAKEEVQIRGQLEIDFKALNLAVGKLKAYEESRVRYDSSLASLKAQEAVSTLKVETLTKKLDDLTKELEIAEELKRGLKSYLSCSFDDALEEIGTNATKLIRNIPNMANATIQLAGIRETQKGKIKEEVNAVIHVAGEVEVPIKSLSGGERSAVDLTIDLAVINLIEDRTAKGINLYILDEPCTSMDSINTEQVIEMIKQIDSNKTIIIVEHNPIIKEMVTDKITVIRKDETSRIGQ